MQIISLALNLQILFLKDLTIFRLINYQENVSTKKSSCLSWNLLILVKSIEYFLMLIYWAIELFDDFYSLNEFICNLKPIHSPPFQILIILIEVYFRVLYSQFINYFAFHFYLLQNLKCN